MQLTQKLRYLFISDLEKYSPILEEDLKNLLTSTSIPYFKGKEGTDVVAFCFEYDHKELTIFFYALGKGSKMISDILFLPTQRIEKHFPSDKFVIEEEDLEDLLYETELEENEIEDLLIEYQQEKQSIFTNWFIARWKNVTEQLNVTIDAYFSKLNSFYKTDLNSLEPINIEEIEEKYNNIV
ncbi:MULTISPECIES: hypothetical protein [unclassified Capnocytophaga]|uniref:hypothetical protein n=1 Tax=unclassified Capnocytophaga TaxID=2640652 RepID=UPI000202ED35|nr:MULTISPECIES: hypothetical protein [unclassified Capnocytophaga]EGD34240.1 hypothetical protein HMPREF9071_1175 [Capnocytophaga sp. oral taxon 338 str. F0234]MEB3004913.1 hypothetical protein [Capnocytophaga sp. G2]